MITYQKEPCTEKEILDALDPWSESGFCLSLTSLLFRSDTN